MCRSMVDIQSPTAEIRRGKKRKKKIERNYRMKILWSALLHRATIISRHKSKENRNRQSTFKNCSYVCAYHCAQLSYTIQHRTVATIFALILLTIIIAQTLSTGGTRKYKYSKCMTRFAKFKSLPWKLQ